MEVDLLGWLRTTPTSDMTKLVDSFPFDLLRTLVFLLGLRDVTRNLRVARNGFVLVFRHDGLGSV